MASLCVQFWSSVLHCQEGLSISEMSNKTRRNGAFQKRAKGQSTVLNPVSGAAVGLALISSSAVTFLDSAWV